MISRILHLLAIDMMSVGLAVRHAPAMSAAASQSDGQQSPAPGALISHIA